ncbi:hypothetical protein CC78DRAFT_492479 [Lojkania enalia]|uniref:Auxiliary Activity family 9 catalytic domain-containing protein n=1 Tax=Lojkania enalia TaxID=147567 RepID=A0A9P4N5F8_9PLEO|nr:hypothetical protein CC78DRAFT_492479 [Didymosphaeria enalia]
MSKIFVTGALFAALFSQAAGHTSVEKAKIGGKVYEGFRQGSKQDPGNQSPAWWTNQGWGYDPVFGDKINHPDIIAHIDADPSPYTAEAPAGSDVTFTWHHVGECESGEEGWDCSHHGWTSTYLAPCNGDCANVDKTSLEFFKIHQAALIDYRDGRFSQGSPQEQTGYWGTDAIFYTNNNEQTVTIPKDIPSAIASSGLRPSTSRLRAVMTVHRCPLVPRVRRSIMKAIRCYSGICTGTPLVRLLRLRRARSWLLLLLFRRRLVATPGISCLK